MWRSDSGVERSYALLERLRPFVEERALALAEGAVALEALRPELTRQDPHPCHRRAAAAELGSRARFCDLPLDLDS
jgi:hypothetical protein